MIKQLSIGQKLAGSFSILCVVMVSLVFFFISQMALINLKASEVSSNYMPSVVSAGKVYSYLINARRLELGLIVAALSDDKAQVESIKKDFEIAKVTFNQELSSYGQLPFSTDEERKTYEALTSEVRSYYSQHDRLMAAILSANKELVVELRTMSRATLEKASALSEELQKINIRLSNVSTENSKLAYEHSRSLGVMAGGLTILIVIAMAWFITQQIRRPLLALLTQTNIVAQGDLTSSLNLNQFHEDELGDLAKGFSVMHRNLTILVGEISSSVAQLSSSAEEISTVAQQSAENIGRQQHELNQLATAMNEMQATVGEVARSTSDAAHSAGMAKESSVHGLKSVEESISCIEAVAQAIENTSQVITKLGEDSNNIGVVLDVIKGIAEQTNLLALNAAIEAARAGEQGRGFAVVADEVRTLAQRTQESTEQINKIITDLQSRATNAASTMEQSRNLMGSTIETARLSGISISQVSDSIGQINQMNIQIAAATEEQGVVSEELNRNVTNISHAADDISDGASQMAQACTDLSHLSSQLFSIVGKFKV